MNTKPAKTYNNFEEAVGFVGSLLATQPDKAESALEEFVDFGKFDGIPAQIELDDNGCSARLLRAITYHGPKVLEWPVPVGAWLDGASIPRIFWSIIGGPFEGKYRTASIIHDHYCIIQTRSWRETHLMFHDAMRCSGVGKAQATVMYYAVYRFGPRWVESGLELLTDAADEISDANADSFVQDVSRIVAEELGTQAASELADAHNA
ncbi:DUF1353 domain-containing protein [Pseudomonas chlororaphis]|uniref:DUF1353 domain-containing protein n=1 Tax=Pseudomonas chlororaphis TaxID=587753 RepID=UPI002368A2BE|nr:DUF1353 domain-containing protein [Pseudomonas chlororaphis]WDH32407.1 DUF1353 domain-containing protein [Pseudomonas chlororaphis]WDH38491.1 DUF1353 domain-containing protein [Pseudomonas chlororaphis]